jgi:hypothetical protein
MNDVTSADNERNISYEMTKLINASPVRVVAVDSEWDFTRASGKSSKIAVIQIALCQGFYFIFKSACMLTICRQSFYFPPRQSEKYSIDFIQVP